MPDQETVRTKLSMIIAFCRSCGQVTVNISEDGCPVCGNDGEAWYKKLGLKMPEALQ